jgi:hypothetical protein
VTALDAPRYKRKATYLRLFVLMNQLVQKHVQEWRDEAPTSMSKNDQGRVVLRYRLMQSVVLDARIWTLTRMGTSSVNIIVVSEAVQLLASCGVNVENSWLLGLADVIIRDSASLNHSSTSAAELCPWKLPVKLWRQTVRKAAMSLADCEGLLNNPFPPVLCSLLRACALAAPTPQSSPPGCAHCLQLPLIAPHRNQSFCFFFL